MTTRAERPCPIVLVVIDGFGIGSDPAVDAIAAADMPRWRALVAEWPHARLEASGAAVGLPDGQMGNSEVGHLNLGAGRPVLQDLPRIDAEIADGSVRQNAVLLAAVRAVAERGSRLHLVGLIGPGGVHSVDRHAVAIAGAGPRSRRPGHRRPRAARRSRHAAPFGGRLHPRLRGPPRGGSPGRPLRHDRRPLLRHGPRQPLGAHPGLVRGHGPRPRLRDRAGRQRHGGPRRRLRPRRERRVRQAHARGRRGRPGPRRRRRHPLQLPGRPGSPAHARPGGRRLRRASTAAPMRPARTW